MNGTPFIGWAKCSGPDKTWKGGVLVTKSPPGDNGFSNIPFRVHTFTEIHHSRSHASFLVLFPSDCFGAILRQTKTVSLMKEGRMQTQQASSKMAPHTGKFLGHFFLKKLEGRNLHLLACIFLACRESCLGTIIPRHSPLAEGLLN